MDTRTIKPLATTAVSKRLADRDAVALAELTVDLYNLCRHAPDEASEYGVTAPAMLRRLKALFEEIFRRTGRKAKKQDASALVLAMDSILWDADDCVFRDYGRAAMFESRTAGIINEYESERTPLLTDAEYIVHLLNIPTFLDAEKKLKERKVRKALKAWADGHDPDRGWAGCDVATALWRLRVCLEMDTTIRHDEYDEMFGIEAWRMIDCDKSSFSNAELIAFGDMVEDLVEWYSPNKTQVAASRRELKAELEKRLGGEDDFAVRCSIARLDLKLRICEQSQQRIAEEDARFTDEVLAPIMGVTITSGLSDAELAALAVAYCDRQDMVATFDEGYSPEAIRYCRRRMSELYLALMEKEAATDDLCRKAGYLAMMAELGKMGSHTELDLTFKQLSYPFDRMKAFVATANPLSSEAEALLMQTETAEMVGTEDDEWQRLTAVADRWVSGFAADQWHDLTPTTVLSRAAVLTTLSINMEQGDERQAKYKEVAESAAKCAADKLLADGDAVIVTNPTGQPAANQLLLVCLYHIAELLHAESDGFFSGSSPWRDTMRSVATALAATAPDSLAARAIAVSESAWVAKTAGLADYL